MVMLASPRLSAEAYESCTPACCGNDAIVAISNPLPSTRNFAEARLNATCTGAAALDWLAMLINGSAVNASGSRVSTALVMDLSTRILAAVDGTDDEESMEEVNRSSVVLAVARMTVSCTA